MTSLITCLGPGKGTWTQLKCVIKAFDWEKILVVTNAFGAQKFSAEKKIEFIIVDNKKDIFELSEDIKKELYGKIKEFEVAVNLVSGDGKMHMAVISAVLKSGFSIRLVDMKENSVEEL